MSSNPDTQKPSDLPSLRPTFLWLALVAVLGLGVGYAMAWFGDRTDLRSPIDTPVVQATAGGEAMTGLPAADFRLVTVDGRPLGPPDFLGQVVVAELWATWCGPCKLQAQYLEQLHAEMDGQGVQFLAINSGENLPKVQQYVSNSPFSYPVLLDPDMAIQNRYQVSGLPTLLVIDATGQVVFRHTGVISVADLRVEIDKAKSSSSGQTV